MTTQARELAKLVSNSGDLNFIDDITLGSDGALLNFGADSDVVITHVADTGLLLNSSRQLQFGDSGTHIRQSADGVLNITSDTEVEINATTIDINGNVDISGNLVLGGNITIGDADSDDISFGGELTSHIIPNADDTYDLGSSSKQWRNVYVDGTLEADAITIGGTTLSETIADTVGAMVSSNTETNIVVSYDDSDNTLDFVIPTLNQGTTGNAGTATALETARTIGGTSFDGTANIAVALSATTTALATSRTIHGVGFDGTANIDLSEVISDTVGAMFSSNTETGIAATYQDGDNTIDLVIGDDVIVQSMISDNAIDSQHYVDGSIDTAHIGDDQITTDKLANAINEDIASKATTGKAIAMALVFGG